MVIQYPHTGKVYLPGDSQRDATGNWIASDVSLQLQTKCRAEPARGSQYVVGLNGQQITFWCIVYMPIPDDEVKPGMLFEVWDGENLIIKTDVKQFSRGQLNARVWL